MKHKFLCFKILLPPDLFAEPNTFQVCSSVATRPAPKAGYGVHILHPGQLSFSILKIIIEIISSGTEILLT
ncbi:hypothetical protein BC829DRAFT_389425 [Chytridium lagenaria]|nr:hypothetical protein BC829DRAFT_389425 [Chytridium lagenaria]